MEVTESKSNLHGEELYLLLRESFSLVLEVLEDHAALYKWHKEIDAVFILENEVHVNQKWVVYCPKNILLHGEIGKLFIFDNKGLSDTFHGKEFPSLVTLNEIHLAERTLTNKFYDLKRFESGARFRPIKQAYGRSSIRHH